MADLVELPGGDGVPPEPNWRSIFGRAADRDAAAVYWRDIISELRTAEKLAVANAHSIKRLVVAYVTYDISAREVLKTGPVIKAKKTGVPTYNPWWTTMSNAASQAEALEKNLCVSPRDRNSGGKVERKQRRSIGADRYLKNRSGG
jgi:P27 family predicted phage terminase small subunit